MSFDFKTTKIIRNISLRSDGIKYIITGRIKTNTLEVENLLCNSNSFIFRHCRYSIAIFKNGRVERPCAKHFVMLSGIISSSLRLF